MRLINCILPWFVVVQSTLSLTLPPSINLYKRALSSENFENRIPIDEDPFWQEELLETIQVVRLLAGYARQVPQGHEIGREWFGGDDFYDLRTRIFDSIIDIIDNPFPHFRIIRAPQLPGLPIGTIAQTLSGQWANGVHPELTNGEARRTGLIHLYPAFWEQPELFQNIPLHAPGRSRINADLNTRAVLLFHEFAHLASWMLGLEIEHEGFSPEFLAQLLDDSVEHPNSNEEDDGSSPTYPEEPDILRYHTLRGQILEDLVPERFLTTNDVQPSEDLVRLGRRGGTERVAYDAARVRLLPNLEHGEMAATMNAQNYAAFALAAFRNQPVAEANYENPDEDLRQFLDFAADVGAPPSPNIRAGEGWPNLNPDLQNPGVRYMLAATEIWLDYNQLGSDFLKKGS